MDRLFCSGELREYLKRRRSSLNIEVDSLDVDYLLKVSEADLQEYLVAEHTLEAPQLMDDEIYQHEPRDVEVEVHSRLHDVYNRGRPARVKGTAITISIPFEGNADLLMLQPSTFNYNPPQGRIVGKEIRLTYELPHQDAAGLRKSYEQDLGKIREYVGWVQRDVSSFNESLSKTAQQAIARRKQKILGDQSMSAALGIPIKRRKDAPKTYTVPDVRRKSAVQRPKAETEEPFQPEPTLPEVEYECILEIVQNMVAVMERSPQAFAEMGEEDLRSHFLVQLNGQYEGQATGETFNFSGKTDILIRVDGRNIFIGECKFWTGPKGLTDAIDQLLGYASWRDTKTAILVFNRNKNFRAVLAKIPGVVEKHPCFKREISRDGETNFRYVFHQPNDPNRELLLTVLAFDIPK